MADSTKDYETIEVSVSDRVCRVMFNRPEKRNALNLTLLHELNAALRAADADENVKVRTLAEAQGPEMRSWIAQAARVSGWE